MSDLKILVVNNYGQFCHLIHRAVRDLDEESGIIANTLSNEEILAMEPDGLIISGGPSIDRIGRAGEMVQELDLPILGICLGHQLIARAYGGDIATGHKGGYAAVKVDILDEDEILKELGSSTSVWASHADEVTGLPPDFVQLARSDVCEIEAMRHKTRPLFGVQWHPEVSHTEKGDELLLNF
ncbi:MAG TPA: GMP synthase subunit A, partial [Methanosarcinales archaeon]|nr:GMP synthase subunit A [Methanosarcinales archaeon]